MPRYNHVTSFSSSCSSLENIESRLLQLLIQLINFYNNTNIFLRFIIEKFILIEKKIASIFYLNFDIDLIE